LGLSSGGWFGFELAFFLAGGFSHTLSALPPVDFFAVCAVLGIMYQSEMRRLRSITESEIDSKA
jgi:hypothetical protein